MTLLTSRHTFHHLLGVTLRGELREQAALWHSVCRLPPLAQVLALGTDDEPWGRAGAVSQVLTPAFVLSCSPRSSATSGWSSNTQS